MPILDFEKEFADFTGQNGGSAIKDIYQIIPHLNQEQLQVVITLRYMIAKYQLDDLQAFLDEYLRYMKANKNLNFLSSMNMKALLKAYTQEELIRGVKVNQQTVRED